MQPTSFVGRARPGPVAAFIRERSQASATTGIDAGRDAVAGRAGAVGGTGGGDRHDWKVDCQTTRRISTVDSARSWRGPRRSEALRLDRRTDPPVWLPRLDKIRI